MAEGLRGGDPGNIFLRQKDKTRCCSQNSRAAMSCVISPSHMCQLICQYATYTEFQLGLPQKARAAETDEERTVRLAAEASAEMDAAQRRKEATRLRMEGRLQREQACLSLCTSHLIILWLITTVVTAPALTASKGVGFPCFRGGLCCCPDTYEACMPTLDRVARVALANRPCQPHHTTPCRQLTGACLLPRHWLQSTK